MMAHMDSFGNPSSIYSAGKETHRVIERARRSVALILNSTARRIVFTGGGSESNNLAIKGLVSSNGGRHIITSCIEHPSVLNTCRWLETRRIRVTYLPVNERGQVSPDDLEAAITPKTCLVSIMLANNETGVIQPIAALARIAKAHGVVFHTDAVQAAGKIPLDVEELGVDLLSMSGHKFGGPKGVGVLYIRNGINPDPLICGGHQEEGYRAGTENVMGIAGLGRAAELIPDRIECMEAIFILRDRLREGISDIIHQAYSLGDPVNGLPNTLCMVLPGIRGESLVMALDRKGIAISSGSACRSGAPEPSHVLTAMGLEPSEAHCAVRISLGPDNTEEDIDRTIAAIDEVVHKSRDVIRFVACR